MPRPSVKLVLTDFREEVHRSNQLLASVRNKGIPFFQAEQIAELSFLNIYLAWETFLEESFIRFLHGARLLSGKQVHRYMAPRSLEHARRLLVGLDKGGRYADWTKRETVTERAKLMFKDGAPFVDPMRAAAKELDDMRTLRDCIAHRSEFVRKQFGKVIHSRTGIAQSIHPGRFLLRPRPGGAETFLEFFSATIILVAEQVTM
jgi:hypothetical protein